MVTTTAASRCIAALVILAACGGDPFVFNPDAAAGNPDASDIPDAARDAIAPSRTVFCPGNNLPCSRTANPPETCCTAVDPSNPSSCTGGSCASCDTQLECASDFNCAAPTPFCCIGKVNDSSCTSGHYYAKCEIACLGSESRLCDPRAGRCPPMKPTCSADSGDLQNVQLPSGQGYGVCQ